MKHATASTSSLRVSCIVDGFEIAFSVSWVAPGSCAVCTHRNEQMRHAECLGLQCRNDLRQRVVIGKYTYSYSFEVQ